MKLLKKIIVFTIIIEMLVSAIPSSVLSCTVNADEIEVVAGETVQEENLLEDSKQEEIVVEEDDSTILVTEEPIQDDANRKESAQEESVQVDSSNDETSLVDTNPEETVQDEVTSDFTDIEEISQDGEEDYEQGDIAIDEGELEAISEEGETAPGPGKYKITIQLQKFLPQSEYTNMYFRILNEDRETIFTSNAISDYFPTNKEDRYREISATVNLDQSPSIIVIRAKCASLGENDTLVCEAPFNYGYCVDGEDEEEGKTFCTYSIESLEGKGPLYYVGADGEIHTREQGQYEVFKGKCSSSLSEHWYAFYEDYEVDKLEIYGNCHLVVCDGVNIKVLKSGIRISDYASSLNIYGQKYQTGTLETRGNKASTTSVNPGIGGIGDITINGGHIIALGGQSAPGIGYTGFNSSVTGNITINGGIIEAQGGVFIGGVQSTPYFGSGIGGYCKNITINGGTITAKGGKGGAGIGGSFKNITINGGTITAVGDTNGAGIGGDGYFYPAGHYCGDIVIKGGVIDASVKAANNQDECTAAAIGAGDTYCQTGNITITGGKIRAYAEGSGAAIGTSSATVKNDYNIIIGTAGDDDSKLSIAAVGEKGAGIGKSGDSTGEVNVNIQINSGLIVAGSIESGAGIGGGREGNAGVITINGGKIYAQGAGANIDSLSLYNIDPLSFYKENKELSSMSFLEEMKDDYLVRDLFYHSRELLLDDYLPHEILPAAGIGSGGNGYTTETIKINGGIVAACSGSYFVSSVGNGMSTVNEKRFPTTKVQLYKDAKVAYGEYEDGQMKLLGVKDSFSPMELRKAAVSNNNFALIEPGANTVIFDIGKDEKGKSIEIEGEPLAELDVGTGIKIERPENPVHKKGKNDGDYLFDDWYEDAEHTIPFDFNKEITTGVRIYGNWTKVYPITIQAKFDDSSEQESSRPDIVWISYEEQYKVGNNEKVRSGMLTLKKDESNEWKSQIFVSKESAINLTEKYTGVYSPNKWDIKYNNTAGTEKKYDLTPEHDKEAIAFQIKDIGENKELQSSLANNTANAVITVTNIPILVYSEFKVRVEWDPDDEDTVKPEYVEVILLKYDNFTGKWIKETGTSENPIEPIKKVYASNNWETEYNFSAIEGTKYLIREAYKDNPSDSDYKIAFMGSDEEVNEDKSTAVYGNIEYDVTYEHDFGNTTVITNHARKFDYEVIWKNPEDYNPYNEITIVFQYNDNGTWIDVDSAVIKRAPSGSPAGTPYKNVTITTDSDGNVHMNGTFRGWYKGTVTKEQETQKYRIREMSKKDSDNPDKDVIEYAPWDSEWGAPKPNGTRGEMTLHDESVVGRETHTYDINYDVDDNGKTIITNTQKGSFSVQKVWNSEYKPESLDVVLLEYMYNSETKKNYWKVIERTTLSAVDDCDWKYTFNTIQSGRGDWDSKYCVQELDAEGNIILDSDDTSFYWSSISTVDVYDETDQLMNKKEEISYTQTVEGKETKLYFRPSYEVDVANGKVTITNDLRNGVNVSKVWKGSEEVGKPSSIKVVLQKKNDYGVWENVKDPVELNEANQFKTSFMVGLTKKNGSGINFNDLYRIREVDRIENEGEENETVKIVYDGNDLDKPEDYKASVTYNVAAAGGESTDVSYDVTYEIKENGETVITNSSQEKLINIEKSWDIDFERTDKPDSIQVLIQAKNGDDWENAGIVELSDSNSWKVSKALPETRKNGDKEEKIEYRVRELREETALSELMNSVKSQIEAGKEQYDSWISALKSNGKAYWDKLPEEVRQAADESYDSLIDELNTTPENLYSKLMEQFAFASAENRIVYDEKDDEAKDIDEDDKTKEPNKVTYHVKEKSSLTYGTIEAHVTKYLVSYDKSDDTYKINNQAILEIDVIKRWLGIGVDEEDMPDSVWVVLMYHPKAGQDGSIPNPVEGAVEYEIPVINPIEGGNNPISIISQLALGIDLGIFGKLLHIPTMAIAKVTKDDNWTKKFVVSKYTLGIATEFKGAELGSEIIRQIIKYLTGFDLPISYNPFGGFISIPTKAIKTFAGITNPSDLFDVSKLVGAAKTKAESLTMDDITNFGPSSLLDDWHLMANVINLKFAFDGRDENDPGKRKGVKVWENDTKDKRPDTLTIKATNVNNPSDVHSVTLYKADFGDSNQWSWTIEGTDDAAEYTYSEEYPAGFVNADKYQLVVSGSILTNIWTTNSDNKVTISGRKTWDDNNNAKGIRPKKITVRLYADGEEVATADTSAAAGWKWYFANQPKKNPDGSEIKYTISEDSVEGYESSIDGYNITNKCDDTTVGKSQINVRKVWVDGNNKDNIRPESIVIKLYADGTEVDGKILTLNVSNGWAGSFKELPVKDENEKEINYTVKETLNDVITGVDGDNTYSYELEGDAKKGFTIYNYHTPKVTVNVEKVWDDNENLNSKRPGSITVRLLRDGAEVSGQAISITAADGWKGKFENLPGRVDGKIVTYSIREDAVDNYKSTIENTSENEFKITNTYTEGKTQVNVQKIWKDNDNSDGLRPGEIRIWLYADGKKTDKSLTLTAEVDWKGSFTDIPIYSDSSNTKRIKYTVKEELNDVITGSSSATSYSVNVSGEAKKGYTITNTHTSVITSVSGKKTWDDYYNSLRSRPDSITVRLKADGVEIDSKKVTARDEWKWNFVNLPLVKNGRKVKYTISEDAVDNYTTTVNGYDITNKYASGKTQVNVTKIWQDSDDLEGIRPASVSVQLFANGDATSKIITLTEDDGWMGCFMDLPVKDDEGKKIAYTIQEIKTDVITGVDGEGTYSILITGNAKSGYTITNKHSTAFVTLEGSKMWDFGKVKEEDRPTSVTVYLKEEGKTVLTADRSVKEHRTASKANGWKWKFENLPKFKNGREIKYSVVEYSMDNYISNKSGNDILNTSAPGRTQVNVVPVWEDMYDTDGIRPSSVTVRLIANNVPTGRKIVLSDNNNWTGSFKDLAIKDENDNPIEYNVEEETTEVITGIDGPATYSFTVESEGENNRDFVITNIHSPKKVTIEGEKTWSDFFDVRGKRPASITVRLYADGKEVDVKNVTEEDDWKWSFEENKYNKGREIVYTISEDAVEDYVSEISGFNIKNTYSKDICKITYVLNGGIYAGSTRDIVEYYDQGTVISIHEAPERAGFTFTYWKGSQYQPGDSYVVTTDHVFTAQWKPNSGDVTPSVTPTPTPEPSVTPGVTPTPEPSVTPGLTPIPGLVIPPIPNLIDTPTPDPSETPTPEPEVTPTVTPIPVDNMVPPVTPGPADNGKTNKRFGPFTGDEANLTFWFLLLLLSLGTIGFTIYRIIRQKRKI